MINESATAANLRVENVDETLEAAEHFAKILNVGQSETFCSIEEKGAKIEDNTNWFLAIHSYSTKIKCTVTKTGANSYSATINYYMYDVFDWDYTDTDDFMIPIINISSTLSQQDLWELQYGGFAKGFNVTGENVLQVSWTTGQRMNSGLTIISDV